MLLRKPEDVSVQLGESAQFFCEADGDPMPSVEWSRDQGPLPNGRSDPSCWPSQTCWLLIFPHHSNVVPAGFYEATVIYYALRV